MQKRNSTDTALNCKHCNQRLNGVRFESFKFGVGHIGYEVGKYCKHCRILFAFNKTIKVEIMYPHNPI